MGNKSPKLNNNHSGKDKMVTRIMQAVEHSEPLARVAVATSFGSSAVAWIGVANEVLTLIATTIAIISGLFAIRFYYLKSKHEAEKDK